MKSFVTFILLWFFAPHASSQCLCPPVQPDLTTTQILVSNADQLQQALISARDQGGPHEILLENGEYTLKNNLLYIGPGMKHLTIRSKSGNAEDVIIRGQGMRGNVTHIFNVAASHFTAADMTIGWVANHAIQIHAENNADSCLIQNIKFYDIFEQMLKVSGGNSSSPDYSDGGVIQCCHFEFTNGVGGQFYTGGIDAHKSKGWRVFSNEFYHIRSPEQRLAEHAIHFWNDCHDNIVENNTIINCDRGIGFGLGDRGTSGGLIINNFVHTSRDVGIGLETSPGTKVYNNTVDTEPYFNSIEYRFQSTQDVHIANNLVNKSIRSRDGGASLVEYNYTFRDHSIFKDYFNHDYHLAKAVSGITDAALRLPELQEDIDCQFRGPNEAPDVGADEWNTINSQDGDEFVRLHVWPNPSQGILLIQSEREVLFSMFDANGKAVLEGQGKEVHAEHLPPGIYWLSIDQGKHKFIEKIILMP